MVSANLIYVVFDQGSVEAAHASGLYRYPHEVLTRSKPLDLTGVLAPLQRWLWMAEVLSFESTFDWLERRKKKEEPKEQEQSPAAFFFFFLLEPR